MSAFSTGISNVGHGIKGFFQGKTEKSGEVVLQTDGKENISMLKELYKQKKAHEIARANKGLISHLENQVNTGLAKEKDFNNFKAGLKEKMSSTGHYCQYADNDGNEHGYRAYQIVKDSNGNERRLNIFPPGDKACYLDVKDQAKFLLRGLKSAGSKENDAVDKHGFSSAEAVSNELSKQMEPEAYRLFMDEVEGLDLKFTEVRVKSRTYCSYTLGNIPSENDDNDAFFLDVKNSDQLERKAEEERKRAHSESEIKDKARQAAAEEAAVSEGRRRSNTN